MIPFKKGNYKGWFCPFKCRFAKPIYPEPERSDAELNFLNSLDNE